MGLGSVVRGKLPKGQAMLPEVSLRRFPQVPNFPRVSSCCALFRLRETCPLHWATLPHAGHSLQGFFQPAPV